MQIALNSGIFPTDWTPEQKVEATARVGASGLEINIDATALWTERLTDSDRRALRSSARDAGVAITSLCLNAHWVFNLASPDVRMRNLGVSLMLDAIDMAAELGASAVLVPGCDQPQSPDHAWELFRNGVMQGLAHAQRARVRLALEAVGKPFLFDTARLLTMIEACGGWESLGIYLDVGNATAGGLDPAVEVEAAGDRAVLCHVKDWDPADRSRRYLGAGAVDFAASLTALRRIGYDGPLIVELPPDPAQPDAVARRSVEFLTPLLQGTS